jgi:hypothetical protein
VLDAALTYFHPAIGLPLNASAGRRIDLETAARSMDEKETPETDGEMMLDDSIVLMLVDRTFGTEPLSAMAPALRQIEQPPVAAMNPDSLALLGGKSGATITVSVHGGQLTLPVAADPAVAPGMLVVPRHHRLAWQVGGETRLAVQVSRIKVEN